MSRLADVSSVTVPSKVIATTLAALREFGTAGCEGFALWVGRIDARTARVTHVVVPPQHPLKGEDGVGYFIDGATLFALNVSLNERNLRLIAQVHSHPREAYHSPTDDRYAIVTTEGGFSLVVPNFGNAPADLASWAVYRLHASGWNEVAARTVGRLFQVHND